MTLLSPPRQARIEAPVQGTDRRSFLKMTVGLYGLTNAVPGCCEPIAPPLSPEDFGAKAGGDSTVAIQRLADYAAQAGRTINGNGRSYHVDRVTWPSHTRLSNIRLILNPGDSDDRSPVSIGRRGEITRDLIFTNVHVDGNRLKQEGVGRSGYADGARSGFQMKGKVEAVTLRNCAAINCATDGIMIFSDLQHGADDSHVLRDILLANVTCIGNRRHGLSADGFRGLHIRGCRFSGNGGDLSGRHDQDHGGTGARFNGALYGRPFDIEDYLVGTGWADLMIEDSDFRGNQTGALVYSPVAPDSPGFIPRRDLQISRCSFDEPGGNRWDPPLGIAQALEYRGTLPTFKNVRLIDNIFDGAPLRVSGIDGLSIKGGRILVSKKNEIEPLIASNCRNIVVDVKDIKRLSPIG